MTKKRQENAVKHIARIKADAERLRVSIRVLEHQGPFNFEQTKYIRELEPGLNFWIGTSLGEVQLAFDMGYVVMPAPK